VLQKRPGRSLLDIVLLAATAVLRAVLAWPGQRCYWVARRPDAAPRLAHGATAVAWGLLWPVLRLARAAAPVVWGELLPGANAGSTAPLADVSPLPGPVALAVGPDVLAPLAWSLAEPLVLSEVVRPRSSAPGLVARGVPARF
jgi:hypothetical protein